MSLPNKFLQESIVSAIQKLEKTEIKSSLIPVNFPYFEGLNDKQKLAASRLEGNYLVIAGPGSGKTHTLLYRVLHMVNMGISSSEICVVTFTNKAAKQMSRRLEKLIPGIKLGFIGTLHSLAHTIIVRGMKNKSRLLDPEDDLMVLRLSLEESNVSLPKGTKIQTIHKIIDYSEVTCKPIKDCLIDLNKESLKPKELLKIKSIYQDYKRKNGYMNYSDLISLATGLDKGNLKYLIIDEYQDTDPLQLNFIKSMEFPNVMAIGDDFQSIYAFRGADNKIILNFANDFSNAQVIKLDVNYRSVSEIVEMENQITSLSRYGYQKDLISNRGASGQKVEWISPKIEKGKFIFNSIKEQLSQNDNSTVAVIYRYNNQKTTIESELIKNKIDYVVFGGLKLLERKHIKDLCAIILTTLNKNDFISYLRTLMLLDSVGEVKAKHLMQDDTGFDRPDYLELKKIIFSSGENLQTLLSDSIHFYMSLKSVMKKSYYTSEEILNDFKVIKGLASSYTDATNFVVDVILDTNKDKWSSTNRRARVYLTTIHSAKGLEFEQVHFQYTPIRVFDFEKAEENRRLFYTAISRAKDKLYIYDDWGRTDIGSVLPDFEIGYVNQKMVETIHEENINSEDVESKVEIDYSWQVDERTFNEVVGSFNKEELAIVYALRLELKNFLTSKNLREAMDLLEVKGVSSDIILFTCSDDSVTQLKNHWEPLKQELEKLFNIVLKREIVVEFLTISRYHSLMK